MIKNDQEMRILGDKLMSPYTHVQRKERMSTDGSIGIISYGQSSFGYDLSIAPHDVRVFHFPWWKRLLAFFLPKKYAIDPKNFDTSNLQKAKTYEDSRGKFIILPPLSYALAVSNEEISVPDNWIGVAVGKSTYARCAVSANITPLEPGWTGYLTLEFSNDGPAPVRMYLDEGGVQVLFFSGNTPSVTYRDRSGKYQSQGAEVVTSRV